VSDEPDAPGWHAIDAALESIYGGTEPRHMALPAMLGGNDPIQGVIG